MRLLLREATRHGIVGGAWTAAQSRAMSTIVAGSDAVTLMPMSLIARELRDRTLATLPVEAPWLGRTFAIIQLTDRTPSPAAERFIRHVIELDAAAAAMAPPRGRISGG